MSKLNLDDRLCETDRQKDYRSAVVGAKTIDQSARLDSLPYATTFLMVALDEGKSVNAYARAVGIHRAAMHRYVRNIGDRARNGSPGLGLVRTERHPTYSNRRQVLLTDKGRLLAAEIFQQIHRGEGRGATIS
jgi:hypothetical protein